MSQQPNGGHSPVNETPTDSFKEAKVSTTLNPNVVPFSPKPGSRQEPLRPQVSSLTMDSQPRTFNGKPLTCINQKMATLSLTNRDPRLTPNIVALNDYSYGDARHAIESSFSRHKEGPRHEALAVLQEGTRNHFILERPFREELRRWPKISNNDPLALKVFADFLKICNGAIPHEERASLNSCEENHKLLQKLPGRIIHKWSQIVVDELDTCGEYPNFACFTEFVNKEAQFVCNANTAPSIMNNDPLDSRSLRRRSVKTSTQTNPDTQIASGIKVISVCFGCKNDGHDIARCPIFAAKTPECKKAFIHGNGLCFGCLKKGHFIKECKRRHICSTCHRHHPTSMHSTKIQRTRPSRLKSECLPTDGLRNREVHHSTRRPSATSSIIPVFVSAMVEPDKEVLTYAILDSQSSSTFILEDVLDKLNVGCQSVKLKLSTMTATDTIVASKNVQDLKVRGLNMDGHIEIKQAYARGFIPMNKCQIPTSQTALQWPHLEHLADKLPPFQDCNVGLLIGYDCPSALAPLEVVIGAKNEAFAQRTQLGWSIIGPSNPHFDLKRSKSDSLVIIHQSKDNV
uniref:uncharacterized protein LOC131138569 n=1 Tax=Doryrhamphus excisus TaxID=161450 RepID=UPI0025AE2E61|nr:uncharacterized protein LOC131138569 [Doryrhamphus excisus]